MKKYLPLLLLAGCVTVPQSPPVASPTCAGPADCSAKWDAAQLYVVKHSQMKIQTVTNVLIETFNPPPYGTELAMRVTKEPVGNGTYRLVLEAWCNNMFSCLPNPREAKAGFFYAISEAR